jgi:hypothetical protein
MEGDWGAKGVVGETVKKSARRLSYIRKDGSRGSGW